MRIALMVTLAALTISLAACGGEAAKPNAAGVYRLVKDQALKDGVKAIADHDSIGAGEEAVANIQAMVESMDMTLNLKPDHTFEVTGQMGGKFQASGTWELDGKDLTIRATHEEGKPREEPEVTKMILEGDTIRMPKDPKAQPFDVFLRRE